MASLATKLVLCLIFATFISSGGADLLENICMNGQPDENRFMNDSLMLQSIACLPLSHTSLPGWNLASENEHSLSWTRNTMLQSTRICQEFIDIPPEEVYEMESNTTMRKEYDNIMEVETMCQLSDSVDVFHSSLGMPMGIATRELYQYRKCTKDADGYEILYQDVKDIPIPVTEGMVRAHLPFAGTLIRPHPDSQLPGSTMVTTVYLIINSWRIPGYMINLILDMKAEQYRMDMTDYYHSHSV